MYSMIEITLESEMSWNNIMEDLILKEAESFLKEDNSIYNEAEKSVFERIKEWIKDRLKDIKDFIKHIFTKLINAITRTKERRDVKKYEKAFYSGSNNEITIDNVDTEILQKSCDETTKFIAKAVQNIRETDKKIEQMDAEREINLKNFDETMKEMEKELDDLLSSFDNPTKSSSKVNYNEFNKVVNNIDKIDKNSKQIVGIEELYNLNLKKMNTLTDKGTPEDLKKCQARKKLESVTSKAIGKATSVTAKQLSDTNKVINKVERKAKQHEANK